uniref:Uncharacterized protein n=1 Tax=Glossina pallidipes TaxID=7398 RepID=A0A1A9ZJ89_GLOPL
MLTSSTSAQEPSIRKRTFIGGSVSIAFISVTIDFNSILNLTFNVAFAFENILQRYVEDARIAYLYCYRWALREKCLFLTEAHCVHLKQWLTRWLSFKIVATSINNRGEGENVLNGGSKPTVLQQQQQQQEQHKAYCKPTL